MTRNGIEGASDTGEEGAGDDAEVSLLDEAGIERRFRLHDVFDLADTAYYLVEAVDDPELVLLLRETDQGLESVDPEEMDSILSGLDDLEPETGEGQESEDNGH